MNDDYVETFLESYRKLPGGCGVYQITRAGNVWRTGAGKIEKINSDNPAFAHMMRLFINQGNQALYFLGSPKTDQNNPTNATVKLGFMEPHHHFVPHAHGVQHFVISTGYTGCKLHDDQTGGVVNVELQPLSIIDIKPNVPHMFQNRSEKPAIIVVANGGLGIEHSDYAVTEAQATQRLSATQNVAEKEKLTTLVAALQAIREDAKSGVATMSVPEKIGDFLATIGERISMMRSPMLGASRKLDC